MKTATDLEKEAELKYPFPLNMCPFVVKKVIWLREKWIKQQQEKSL